MYVTIIGNLLIDKLDGKFSLVTFRTSVLTNELVRPFGALAKHHDVSVGLKNSLVVMDALTGYLMEEKGLVLKPF